MKPQPDLKTTRMPREGIVILSSARMWEINLDVPLADVNPDQLADDVKRGNRILLEQSSEAGVALDWPTMTFHVSSYPRSDVAVLITRVSVL